MKKSEIRLYEIGTATDLKKALLRLLEARSNNIDSEEKALARIESYSLDPAHFLALATAEDSAVGYIWMQNFGAHLRTGKSIARLHDIFVLPDYRRNGIATELFAAGKNWCVANQISYLQWKASQDATGFYQQLGLNGDTESDLAEYPFYEIQF